MANSLEKKTSPRQQKHETKQIVPTNFKVAEYKEKREDIEKDKKIQILFNRALAREKISWLKNIIQDTSDEKFDKFNEDRENFQDKYEKYNSEICEWLKMDKNLSVSVIERESWFDENAKSETGASSFMQLTNDPFDDMKISKKWRLDLYANYFKNIPSNLLKQLKEPNIVELQKILNNEDISKKQVKSKINKIIISLNKNRKNPKLNLLIWNIYLDSLRNGATDKKIDIEIKKLDQIINNKRAVNRFKFLLKEKWIDLEIENSAKLALKNLQKKLENKDNVELRKNFYALSRYNWDNTRDRWVEHKTIYAAVATTAYDLRNNNKIV